MIILLYALIFILLLLLNAFFVFSEFAAVKIRGSQIEELVDQGRRAARLVQHIHAHLDEYLSVCQVGITFASIALGFFGEMVAARFLTPLFHDIGGVALAHTIATSLAVVLVSFTHILFGELLPKLITLREGPKAALLSAPLLEYSRTVFRAPLWLLNTLAQLLLRVLGFGPIPKQEHVSEEELRIILERSQSGGLMSFRRLLMMENIFDMGELKVRDAMRPRSQAICLSAGMSWTEIEAIVAKHRFSRYPLLEEGKERPAGFVHVKELLLTPRCGTDRPDFSVLMRKAHTVSETAPLEQVLSEMQQRRLHMALVISGDAWAGFLTMEDIIEEIVGTIGDEFELEAPVTLGQVLTRSRIILGVEAFSIVDAVRKAVARVRAEEFPAPPELIIRAVAERERLASTYMGNGVAIPHARLSEARQPALVVIRSDRGIPIEGTAERARLLFLLITPTGQPRVHQKLLARVAELLVNSEYVEDRLYKAQTPSEMFDVICTGEMTAID